MNWLRAVLTGCALVAAVILGADGRWVPAAVLGFGVVAHTAMFAYLHRQRRREADTPAGLLGT